MKETYSLEDLLNMRKKDMELIERIEENIEKGNYSSTTTLLLKGAEKGIISKAYWDDVMERINSYFLNG